MRWLAMVLVVSGCAKERPAAPRALDELAHAAFSTFEVPGLVDSVEELAAWLHDEAATDAAWEGLRLTNLTPDDVADIDMPAGTQLSVHVGLANAAISPWALADHAALIVEQDQTWTDPKSFDRYRRTLREGDAVAFAAGEGWVRTDNAIVKSGAFGVTIPYVLRKDYRWVQLADGSQAVVARSWLDETGCSDNGKNCVLQSWGLEVFHGARAGQTRRLYAVWLEVRTEADGLLSEDGKIALMANGNQDILEATDAELARRAGG